MRDSFISMIGLGFSAVAGTIFTILLARNFGPVQFGIFSAVWAIVQIFSAVGDFGLSSALINFLPKHKEQRSEVVSHIFRLQLKLSAILVAIVLAMSLFYTKIVPGSTVSSFYLSAILVFIDIVGLFCLSLLRAEKLFVRATILQVIEAVSKIILISFLFLTNTISINMAIIISVTSVVISTIYGFWGQFSLVTKVHGDFNIGKVIHYSKWIGLSKIFSVFVGRLDPLLLNLLSTSFAAGIFSAASRITMLFTLVISSLGSVVGPRFSEFTDKKHISSYLKKLLLLISFVSMGMLSMIFIAKPIIMLAFGEKYISAIPVFQALTIAMIPFLYSIATTSPLIYSFNEPKFFSMITIVQVILMLAIDLIAIPQMGAFAPVLAIGVSNLFVLVASSWKLKSLLDSNEPI